VPATHGPADAAATHRAAHVAATHRAAHVAATHRAARVAATHGSASAAATAAVSTAAGVLGISQSWRARYRNAEQQGPDDPNNMPRSVHRAISMPEAIPAHSIRRLRGAAVQGHAYKNARDP
jgi:hypothetical protein